MMADSKLSMKTLLRLAGVAGLAGGLAACGGGGGGGGGTTTPTTPTTPTARFSEFGSGFATAFALASVTADPRTLAAGDVTTLSLTTDPTDPG